MAFYDFIDVEEFDEKRNGCESSFIYGKTVRGKM